MDTFSARLELPARVVPTQKGYLSIKENWRSLFTSENLALLRRSSSLKAAALYLFDGSRLLSLHACLPW